MKGSRRMGVPHRRHGRPARPYAFNDRSKYPDSPFTSTYMSSNEVPPSASARTITSVAGVQHRSHGAGGQPGRGPVVAHLRRPERLIGIDVADAGHHRLVEQRSLDGGVLGANPADHRRPVEQRVERIPGDVREGGGQFGPARRKGEPAERPLVQEVQHRPVVGEVEPGPQVWVSGRPATPSRGSARRPTIRRRRPQPPTRNCPLIPRWATTASPSSSTHHRYLPRRRTSSTSRPIRPAAKSAAPPGCRRTVRSP